MRVEVTHENFLLVWVQLYYELNEMMSKHPTGDGIMTRNGDDKKKLVALRSNNFDKT